MLHEVTLKKSTIRSKWEDALTNEKAYFALSSVMLVSGLNACDFKSPCVEVGSLFEGTPFFPEYQVRVLEHIIGGRTVGQQGVNKRTQIFLM